MEKLIEDLKELDFDVEVPSNFRKNVISIIEKEKKPIFYKYVIPAISTAAVILFAAIIVIKSEIGSKLSNEKNNDNNIVANELSKVPDNLYNDDILGAYRRENQEKGVEKSYITTTMDTGELENAKDLTFNDFYIEIQDLLTLNKIESEIKESYVLAKATIEEVIEALYYYRNVVTITKEGEYIKIK